MRFVSTILLAILLIILIGLACVNAKEVTINYYIGETNIAVSMLVAVSLVVGCSIGLLFAFFVFLKQKKYQYGLKRQVRRLENELANLRSMAIKD